MAMTGGTAKCVKSETTSGFEISLYIYYKTSQNIEKNQSTITVGAYIYSKYDIGSWTDFAGSYVGTTSNTFDGTISKGSGTRWLVENKTFTVDHSSDGTGSATIKWKWGVRSTWGGFYEPSGSFTITLPTIARASQPSCITWPENTQNVGDMGNAITIYMNKKANFTHTVKYTFGNASGTIQTGVVDNCSWTIPMNLANQIPSATSGTGTITVITYNGSTKIGEKSCSFTCTVPASVKPSISSYNATIDNSSNSVIQGWGIAVAGYTKIRVTASASGSYGSTISSFTISGGYNTTQSKSSLDYTGAIISSSGSKTFTITAKDSRGRTSTSVTTAGITFYAYSYPTVSYLSAIRSKTGATTVIINSNWSFASVNNKNSVTATLYYKKSKDTNWTNYGSIAKNQDVTLSGTFEEISSYNFRIIVTDALGNSAQNEGFISTIEVLMDWKPGGKGLGIGKIAESDALEIGFDTIFMGDVYIQNADGTKTSLANYIKSLIT